MKVEPRQLSPEKLHALMEAIVVPRPVVLVSTLGEAGAPHLASISWYSTASAFPPVQYFSVMRGRNEAAWVVLQDIQRRGDFVINSVDEALGERLLRADLLGSVAADGFKSLELTALPSVKVKAPRIGESSAQMECVLVDLLELAEGEVAVVFGSVVQFHVRGDIYYNGKIDFPKYRPLGEMAGQTYCRTQEIYELVPPQRDEATGQFRRP